ncbi:MAG: TonB-dependent receptor plug domain-containing protein [Candidatus Cyclobacteriaceae bacterium M2_1C_046]
MNTLISSFKLVKPGICFSIFTIAAVFYPLSGNAQEEDTLRAVEVKGLYWLTTEPGTKLTLLDSSMINSTVAGDVSQLLSDLTPVYFKNYGVSGLASVTLRGTSANHTALMWNGIKIQLPSIQQTDYSILPVIFWDEIGIQYGPSISLNGADIAGGAIHLVNNTPSKKFSAKYLSQFGSFGFQQQAVDITYGKDRIRAKTQLNYKSASNDFPFTLTSGDEVRQQNASLEQFNFLQHLYYQGKNITWKNSFWYGNNDREIPRTITGYNNIQQDSEQQDEFYRFVTSLSGTKDALKWELGYGFLQDELIFNNLENHSKQHIYRGQLNYKLSERILLSGGGQLLDANVETSSYKVEDQLRADYYLKGTANYSQWKAHFGFKQIIIPEEEAPLIPSLGIEKNILNEDQLRVKLSGKVTRHFRYPTFNDLFWNPGGNPDLDPEKGWSTEGTASFTYSTDAILSGEITYFNLQVEDWILWKPTSQGFWAPENVWKVNSQGIETSLKSFFNVAGLPLELNLNYSFIKSLNESLGDKQLIYVPIHQGNLILQLAKNKWSISQRTNFTGKRYTTQDNRESDRLSPFVLFDLSAGYNFDISPVKLSLQGEVDNVFNTEYQTLQNRAVPGRNYQLQLLLTFN